MSRLSGFLPKRVSLVAGTAIIVVALLFVISSVPSVAGAKPDGKESPSPALKIMTFNLRYGTADDGPDSWDNRFGTGCRKKIVVDLIENYQPTILGIQEGLKFQLDYLTDELKNYSWFGKSRGGPPGDDEYNAIFYKSNRVELKDGGTFWLSNTPAEPGSISWGNDLPRIVTWGRFEVEEYPKSVFVYNTHFSHMSSHSREKSADMLHRYASVGSEYPVFVTGDFNSPPESYVWKTLTEGGFEDSWRVSDNRSGPNFTGHGFEGLAREEGSRIDWILCRLPESAMVRRTEVVTYNENGRYPSDHFPVYAEIELPVAEFMVENLVISPENVAPGENVSVSVNAANTGGTNGLHTVELKVEGKSVGSENVNLSPGENKRVSFTVTREKPGYYKVGIENLTGGFTVESPRQPRENFTIVALPDTQRYVGVGAPGKPHGWPGLFDNQTEWIVNNISERNIVFVTHEGDIVEHGDNGWEWAYALHSMRILDNKVPYGFCCGNHDTTVGDSADLMAQFFSSDYYERFDYWGGSYWDDKNNYQLISACGVDLLMLHVEYDPEENVLDWASSVLDNYPDRYVVLTTHSFLNQDGSRTPSGRKVWDRLVLPHHNVQLVLCGHRLGHGSRRSDSTPGGRTVHQIFANYQNLTNGGNGWLRLMTFVPGKNEVHVKTYSPYLDEYLTDSASDFVLFTPLLQKDTIPPTPFDLLTPENGTMVTTSTPTLEWEPSSDNQSGLSHCEVWLDGRNVDNVTETTYTTSELDAGSYEWHVVAVDGAGNERQSDSVFNFTMRLSKPWFVDPDDEVGLSDLMQVAGRFGESGAPGWIPSDVNGNGKVGLSDLMAVAGHWGETR